MKGIVDLGTSLHDQVVNNGIDSKWQVKMPGYREKKDKKELVLGICSIQDTATRRRVQVSREDMARDLDM